MIIDSLKLDIPKQREAKKDIDDHLLEFGEVDYSQFEDDFE